MPLANLNALKKSLSSNFNIEDFNSDRRLPQEFKSLVKSIDSSRLQYDEFSVSLTSSSDLTIVFPNQWLFIAGYFCDYYNLLQEYKAKVYSVLRIGGDDAKNKIKQCVNNASYAESLFDSVNYHEEDRNYLVKFLSDADWWGGGKGIERGDFFVSPILNMAHLINASQGYVADLCRFLAEHPEARKALSLPVSETPIIMSLSPLNEPLQIIYYGAPGTGKSYAIDNVTAQYGSVRTTFHPDSDYASFVGAYKPTMEDVPINSIYGESVQFATGKNGHPGTEKKIVYKYVPQAFLKAYVAAWSNLSEPYFLVIEEINRGNCAQIFGDLFQLLDRNNSGSSSYAIHADEDIMQFLGSDSKGFAALSDEQKDAIRSFVLTKDSGATVDLGQKILDGELLLLPPNLYIWATMNTSDQSLFPIDSAFKRRWNWRYMPIDTQKENWTFEIKGTRYSWGQFLEKINPEIYSLTESSDKQMGYFFAKADPKTGVISEEVFLNKVLFYLWTDVFKDYDVSSELFKNKEKNRSFRFIDFFDKEQPNALQNFIDNLGLDAIEIDIDSIDDEDTPEDGSTPNTPGQKDRSRYSINGEGKYNKRQTVLRSLRKYIENNPTMTATEVIENWNSVNPQLPYFILSADEYEARVSDLKTQRDRYWSVAAANGDKVYITNQWNVPRINSFIELINNSDFGIHIEKVSE